MWGGGGDSKGTIALVVKPAIDGAECPFSRFRRLYNR